MRVAQSIAEVVTNGLCIGCGLCEAVTAGRIKMRMTSYGGLRPMPTDQFSHEEEGTLLLVCPGTKAEPRVKTNTTVDPVWGHFSLMRYAWAGDSAQRYQGSTGGVLTALACYILRHKIVEFVLHIGPDENRPMRNQWILSKTPDEVSINTGSRYGPTAPLAGFVKALEKNKPFAIIAKPCDLGAIHQFSKIDPRVNQLCRVRLTMVCGGQSRLGKSQAVLHELGVQEEELALFRYRGFGCPGSLKVETKDGRSFEKTYQQLWEDEKTWEIETRCKFCPDPLGEAADIVASDVWQGGSPVREDEGFNGIIVRSSVGESLVCSAVNAGDLVMGDTITPRQFDQLQPHQVRKKEVLFARFHGLVKGGMSIIDAPGLRLRELGENLDPAKRKKEINGTLQRITEGRIKEPLSG